MRRGTVRLACCVAALIAFSAGCVPTAYVSSAAVVDVQPDGTHRVAAFDGRCREGVLEFAEIDRATRRGADWWVVNAQSTPHRRARRSAIAGTTLLLVGLVPVIAYLRPVDDREFSLNACLAITASPTLVGSAVHALAGFAVAKHRSQYALPRFTLDPAARALDGERDCPSRRARSRPADSASQPAPP